MPRKTTPGALEQLQRLSANPGDPFPGAISGSGTLNGRYAEVVWSVAGLGTATLRLYEWSVTYEQEFEDATAHGDYWEVIVPSKMKWTGNAKSYIDAANPGGAAYVTAWNTHRAANSILYQASARTVDPAVCTFTGYTGVATTNFVLWQGACWVSRAEVSAPRKGVVTQSFDIRGNGVPAIGPV